MPISAKLVANVLSASGTDRVLTMDLHKAQIQGFFDIPVDHLFAAPVIIDYLSRQGFPRLTIVAPDAGGAQLQQPARGRVLAGKVVAIVGFATVLAVYAEAVAWVTARPVAPGQGIDTSRWTSGDAVVAALEDTGRLLVFIVASLILNFVYAQSGFTLPLQLQGLFGGSGPVYFGVVMTINALSVVLFTAPLVSFSRRFRPLRNMQAVAALYAIGFGMLFFAHQVQYFILSVVIWSIGEVINATNVSVYIANRTPSSHRGRMNGFQPIIWGTGRAINAPIVGALIEHHPISSAWLLAFLLACAGGVLLLVLGSVESRRAPGRSV